MNNTNFPLYKILINKAKLAESITNNDMELFIKFVEKFPDQHEIIYTIIRIFELENFRGSNRNTSELFNIPYSGKLEGKNNYIFEINNLPILLQKMLIQFRNINIPN